MPDEEKKPDEKVPPKKDEEEEKKSMDLIKEYHAKITENNTLLKALNEKFDKMLKAMESRPTLNASGEGGEVKLPKGPSEGEKPGEASTPESEKVKLTEKTIDQKIEDKVKEVLKSGTKVTTPRPDAVEDIKKEAPQPGNINFAERYRDGKHSAWDDEKAERARKEEERRRFFGDRT